MARVLIVDDDPISREVCLGIVLACGHNGVLAVDGLDAHTILDKEAFDIVICDLVMPNKSGLELIEDLKAENSKVGIIAISSGARSSFEFYRTSAQLENGVVFLKKPVSSKELGQAIDQVMASKFDAES